MLCDRFYFYRWVLNLVPQRINLAFWFGSVMHKAVERLVTTKDIVKIFAAMDKEAKAAAKGYKIDTFVAEEMSLQLEIGKRIFACYLELFGKKLKMGTIRGAEARFFIQLEQSPVVFQGTIDAYGKGRKGWYLREYKTAGQISAEYFKRLKFDKQINGYALGLETIVGKYPVECPYVVFRKPSIRVKQNETVPEYLERLEEDLRIRPEFYFLEELITFGSRGLKAVRQDIECTTFDLNTKYDFFSTEQLLDSKNWGRNDRACFNYGTCNYFALCHKVVRPELYYQYYRMRDIRYPLEHEELNKKFAFTTKPTSSIGIGK